MGNPGTRYSSEFKAEAVSQVIDRSYAVKDVAERIGVSQHSLYLWVKRNRQFHRRAARKALLTCSASRFSGRRDSHSTSSVINGALAKM